MLTKICLPLLSCLLALPAQAEPDLVVLVRHAERAAAPAGDPALTAAGQQRALALADALADAGVTAILTTEFKRSIDTAAVLAKQRGLTPELIAARGGDTATHIAAVVAAARRLSGVVLVVGHSNTVPAIAAALGAPRLADFCETSFGHLWVLTKPGAEGAQLLRLRYGAADTPSTVVDANCQ
jgi:broad specificity phosphatase PhoE